MAEMSHLHMHSTYSELDCISKISEIVRRLKEYGHTSAALTDHGTIAGVPEFHRECRKEGIKPILASEFYYMPDPAKAKAEKSRKNHHLILLAMNEEGWLNIRKLTTLANQQFYFSPRIGDDDLRENGNGLICLTACMKGIVPYEISQGNFGEAFEHAKKFRDIFGDRFYMEVQDGGIDEQIKINKAMRMMAQKLDVKVVGCQDAHYIDRNDVEGHEAIWAVRSKDTFDTPKGYGEKGKRPYYSTNEFWLKDSCHILNEPLTTQGGEKRMSTLTQAEIEMSAEIADRIEDFDMELKMHLPKYEFVPDISLAGCATTQCSEGQQHYHPGDIEEGETIDLTSYNFLCELVAKGYEARYETSWLDRPQEHRERLAKELGDIKAAGLADYFLIIWDIVIWCKSEGIPVGPGRGSAAGSMVSYCIRITDIEPLQYGLIWERFYNIGRIGSLADIDIDVSKRDRPKVVKYISDRFGEDKVAQILTFSKIKAKNAIKDAARVLGSKGITPDEANVITRMVGEAHGKTFSLDKSVEENENFAEFAEKNPRLFRLAKHLEECIRGRGVHAAGIVISDEPFSKGELPLRWDTKNKKFMTEYDMGEIDKNQYVKVDILGLKTLDVLRDTENAVNGVKK